LDEGEKPSVLSAILKYQLTEGNRETINDAMDIHGGKAIIQGPNNYLAHSYKALPVAITVEGANILTRSLIIFGQGAIRAHPWLLKEMQAAQGPANSQARRDFDHALFSHAGFTISNAVRALMLGLSFGWTTRAPVAGKTARYYRQLTRMSAAFALLADAVLLTLGGKFKFKESLSGRFADALIHLYLASATLKKFVDDDSPEEDLPLVSWAIEDSLHTIQNSLHDILRNFPVPGLGGLLRLLVFPFGRPYGTPLDETSTAVASLLMSENESRDRLTHGVYLSDADDAAGRVAHAFHLVLESREAEQAIRNALGESVSVDNYAELVRRAVESGVINEEQARLVRLAQEAAAKVIAVDDFPKTRIEGFEQPAFKPALRPVEEEVA
ncbi:MAG: DUF1974 domain-containing protein, partial [Xanthomonadales bacterium]|nr:DUF1974 domain-containing protein [Xanthomonadales bacterium]